jgi:hypothetical protein
VLHNTSSGMRMLLSWLVKLLLVVALVHGSNSVGIFVSLHAGGWKFLFFCLLVLTGCVKCHPLISGTLHVFGYHGCDRN